MTREKNYNQGGNGRFYVVVVALTLIAITLIQSFGKC